MSNCNPEDVNDLIITCCECKVNPAVVKCKHGAYCDGSYCITACEQAWIFYMQQQYKVRPCPCCGRD